MKAIIGGRLFDGTGKQEIEKSTVIIQNKRILALGRMESIKVPEEAEIIDAHEKTIIPGLIDAHVHITDTDSDIMRVISQPFSMKFFETVTNLKDTLKAGFTTIRDAAGADLGVKLAVERGLVPGPRLVISVAGLSQTGGHMDTYFPPGFSIPSSYPGMPDCVCDGPVEVRKAVRSVIRAGADVIKVNTSGGVLSPTDDIDGSQFAKEELEVIVEEAKAANRPVMTHAMSKKGILAALKAGIESIEHGTFTDDECIEWMLKQDSYLVPTLSVAPLYIENAESKGQTIPEWVQRKGEQILTVHKENIQRAFKAGVKIVNGSDSGVSGHGRNARELEMLVEIGMSPQEAIESATRVASRCLGLEEVIGTLEPGKFADLLIIDGNPLENISYLSDQRSIAAVMKEGELFIS